MILKYGIYKIGKALYYINEIYIQDRNWMVQCNKVEPNQCQDMKYYSIDEDQYVITPKKINLAYEDFEEAVFMNSHCFGCRFCTFLDEGNTFIMRYGDENIPSDGECGIIYCKLRSYLNNYYCGATPVQLYANCQFKIKAGYENWLVPYYRVHGKSVSTRIGKIITQYFKELSHNGVIPHESLLEDRIVSLKRGCLNPYQVEFLHNSMKDNDKIIIGNPFNDNLENLSDEKEFFYLPRKNFHVNSYNYLVGDGQRTMISLNGLFMTAAFNQTIYFCGDSKMVEAIKELEL
ncbi:MAG: hypothetical protein ACLSAP_11950 [Oscillospiraceae bacterium]